VVYGNEAEVFADLFHSETRRPMRGGVLNPDEPDGVRLIRSLLAQLAPNGMAGTRVFYSVPGPVMEGDTNFDYHEAALRELLSQMGCEARSIHEGLAVVYSELADHDFTGIGISLGAGTANVSFAYLSVPVISFSIPKAGDFVDRSTAAATGEVATRVKVLKENSFHFNGASPDKLHQALSIYYDALVQDVVAAMCQAFSSCHQLPKLKQPVPVVLSGGSSLPRGFRERFESALKKSAFNVPVSEVRVAADPLVATAKGALIACLAEG
jgi:hypothetical protein